MRCVPSHPTQNKGGHVDADQKLIAVDAEILKIRDEIQQLEDRLKEKLDERNQHLQEISGTTPRFRRAFKSEATETSN